MEKSGLEAGLPTEIINFSGKFHSGEWYTMEQSSLEKVSQWNFPISDGKFHSGGW
jgi:hypothetical protein